MSFMITQIEPDVAALQLLDAGETLAAHLVLADAFDKNPNEVELGRLANLILPCQMISEAKDGLRRRIARPFDPDAGRMARTPVTPPVLFPNKPMSAEQHNAFPKGRW